MQLVGVDHMKLMRCEAANVKCLVAWGHGSLLLAFRGTANFTNALADVKVMPTLRNAYLGCLCGGIEAISKPLLILLNTLLVQKFGYRQVWHRKHFTLFANTSGA